MLDNIPLLVRDMEQCHDYAMIPGDWEKQGKTRPDPRREGVS